MNSILGSGTLFLCLNIKGKIKHTLIKNIKIGKMGVCCSTPQVSPNVQLKKHEEGKKKTLDDDLSNGIPNQFIENTLARKSQPNDEEENAASNQEADDAGAVIIYKSKEKGLMGCRLGF